MFVALGIQTRHDFRENIIGYKIFVSLFSIQLSSETFLILGRNERDMIKNVYQSSNKVGLPVILVKF